MWQNPFLESHNKNYWEFQTFSTMKCHQVNCVLVLINIVRFLFISRSCLVNGLVNISELLVQPRGTAGHGLAEGFL